MLAAFALGNVVALRVGNGTALTDAAAPVFLDEFTPTGSAVQTVAVPTTSSGSNHALTIAGNSALEGSLRRSVDGRYLTLGGYDAAVGTASVVATAAATNNRVIARVAANGTIDTTTVMNDAYEGGTNPPSFRSVVSVDGTSFWTGGQGNTGQGGVRYVPYGNTGSSSPIGILPNNKFNNTRNVGIFGGQLYTSLRTGMVTEQGVATVGVGLPTTSGNNEILLPNLSNANEAVGYFLLDRDAGVPGVDTLYVADQTSGLLKYSFDGAAWTARGSLSGNMIGLTAVLNGNSVDIYATNGLNAGNTLIKVTDTAAFNVNLSGSPTVLATAPANTAFRGVAMAPSVTAGVNKQPTLDPINNPPALNEDAGQQTINLTGISAGAGESQTISISVTSSNTALIPTPTVNYTSPATSGTLTFTPRPDANGSATITVTAKDNGGTAGGGIDTLVRSFLVTVNAVNDPPEFSLIGNLGAVQEDSGTHTVPGYATGIRRGPVTATDENSQTLTFNTSISSTTGGLTFESGPTIDSTGTLSYKAAANGSGSALVSVTLSDNGSGVAPNVNTSAPQTFTITVTGINDPPSFSLAGDPPASAMNAALQTVPAFATDILPGASPEEANQQLTFDLVVVGTTGNLAFSQAPKIDPTTGNLTYQVAPNTQGTASVSATLYDNGSAIPPNSNVSPALLFTITVTQFPWQGSPNPLDVDGDGSVTGIDLIYVVEALNTPGDSFLPLRSPSPTQKVDVNGDNFISALDLVLVVQGLNTPQSLSLLPPDQQSESTPWSLGWTPNDEDDELVSMLAAASVQNALSDTAASSQSSAPAVVPTALFVARRPAVKGEVASSAADTADAELDGIA